MWPFSKKKKEEQIKPADNNKIKSNTTLNSEKKEIEYLERASTNLNKIMDLFNQSKPELQKIFEYAISGKLNSDLVQEHTNEFTHIKNMKTTTLGNLYQISKSVAQTLSILKNMNLELKNIKLTKNLAENELKEFNKTLNEALQNLEITNNNEKIMQSFFLFVEGVLDLSEDDFKHNPGSKVEELSKDVERFSNILLQAKNQLTILESAIQSTINLITYLHNKGLYTEHENIKYIVTQLTEGEEYKGGVERRKH